MNKATHHTKAALVITCVLLAASVLLLVVILPYAAGYGHHRSTLFQTLLKHWSDPTWQHGALAIPIAAFLIWRIRDELSMIPAQPSSTGIAIMICAGLIYYAGYKAHLIYLGFGGVQLFVAGAGIWLFGWQRMKECIFPWLMLSFAWPLLFMEESLAFHLRLLMVACAGGVLDFLGVEVIREGTALMSAPQPASGLQTGALFRMNIDAPCSGLRSLFALMMVGAVYAWHRQHLVWRRWLLFLCSLPLAVLANMARIFLLIGASSLFGQDFAVGDAETEVSTFHFLSGMIVFVIALAGLEALSMLMNRLLDHHRADTTQRQMVRATVATHHP